MINQICDRCGKEKCERLITCRECGKSICLSCSGESADMCPECDIICQVSGQMFNVFHEIHKLEDKIAQLRSARQYKHEEKA